MPPLATSPPGAGTARHAAAAWLLAWPATAYALWFRRRILREGRPLTGNGWADARLAGVRCPDRVRVLVVPRIPNPLRRPLSWLARRSGICIDEAAGMTLGHGIFVVERCRDNRGLLLHELAHVSQYERLGGVRRFIRVYLHQCLVNGYSRAPLEQEARQVEAHAASPT